MTNAKGDNVELLAWMLELLTKVNAETFVADDEGHVEIFAAAPAAARRMMELPSVCGDKAASFELDALEEEDDFTVELAKLIKSKWPRTKRDLCEKALLLENTFYKIQAGRRQPGRDSLICLSLALRLKTREAQRLLGYLGYGLSDHIKRDYIILRCMEMGKEPLDVNLLPENCGLRLLGPND